MRFRPLRTGAALTSDPAPVPDPPETMRAVVFDAEVLFTETTGSDTYVHLRVGASDWVAHLDGLHALAAGSAARFTVAVSDVLCFPAEGTR